MAISHRIDVNKVHAAEASTHSRKRLVVANVNRTLFPLTTIIDTRPNSPEMRFASFNKLLTRIGVLIDLPPAVAAVDPPEISLAEQRELLAKREVWVSLDAPRDDGTVPVAKAIDIIETDGRPQLIAAEADGTPAVIDAGQAVFIGRERMPMIGSHSDAQLPIVR